MRAMMFMSTRRYEVRVTGLVPATVLLELGDVEVTSQEMRTVLSGTFEDQAALYGFLHRLRAFGLDIVEVRRVQRRGDAEMAGDEERNTGDEGNDV